MARRTVYKYMMGGNNDVAAQANSTSNPQDIERARADRVREMQENFKNSLTEQGLRLKAALDLDNYTREMEKQRDQERTLLDSANFRRIYGLLDRNDPKFKEQMSELYGRFPGAIKNSELQKQISEDDKQFATTNKAGLTKEEADFLKNHGPGTSNYDKTRKQVGDVNDPNHINAVLDFKRAWDLKRKAVGMPSDTAGMSMDEMDKFLTGKNQPNAAPTPTTAVPPPSTPGPEAVAGWSNANLEQAAPIEGAQPAVPPTATPPPKAGDAWLQGHFKTSSNDRNDLNDMLNQSPETGFLSNKAVPSPTPAPKPPPPGQTGPQYSLA